MVGHEIQAFWHHTLLQGECIPHILQRWNFQVHIWINFWFFSNLDGKILRAFQHGCYGRCEWTWIDLHEGCFLLFLHFLLLLLSCERFWPCMLGWTCTRWLPGNSLWPLCWNSDPKGLQSGKDWADWNTWHDARKSEKQWAHFSS